MGSVAGLGLLAVALSKTVLSRFRFRFYGSFVSSIVADGRKCVKLGVAASASTAPFFLKKRFGTLERLARARRWRRYNFRNATAEVRAAEKSQ